MIEKLVTGNRPTYNFLEPVDLMSAASGDPLFMELVATEAFQRMKAIRFLGGIDYLLVHSPNGAKGNIRYTRYQHSLGVAALALSYCEAAVIPFEDSRLLYAAALLHDIGHAPLSHSLEPVFKEVYGIAHHQTTEDIVTGRVPLGIEVYNALHRNNVDIERLTAMIAGQESDFHGFFSGPITFDTIEAIIRARSYAQPDPKMLHPNSVLEAALWRSSDRDRQVVDEFWSYKDQVYHHIINSRVGVLADFACQTYMHSNLGAMNPDDYFTTEEKIFRKLPGLLDLLKSRSFENELMEQVKSSISYTERNFCIEQSADFFARDDKHRYRQSKKRRTLLSHVSDVGEPVGLLRDLFDEHGD